MYAIVKTGGKQYRVAEGDTLKVERLNADIGASIELDQVLMIADDGQVQVGTPLLQGSRVTATVLAQGRHPKIGIIKFRRRKHHRKQMGHRQHFTEIQVTGIQASTVN